MKKTVLIIAVICFMIIDMALALVYIRSRSPQETQPAYTPTPSALAQSLRLIDTDPVNNAQNVGLSKIITLTFNDTLTQEDILIVLSPKAPHELDMQNNMLRIIPTADWQENTLYRVTVKYPKKGLPQGFFFTTKGSLPVVLPDTYPEGAAERTEQYDRENNPDVYVANKTPYTGEYFIISSDYTEEDNGRFFFVITVKTTKEQAEAELNDWLRLLKLTDEQIQALDIRYELAPKL